MVLDQQLKLDGVSWTVKAIYHITGIVVLRLTELGDKEPYRHDQIKVLKRGKENES